MAFGALARTGYADLGIGVLVASAAALSGDSAAYWMGGWGEGAFITPTVA